MDEPKMLVPMPRSKLPSLLKSPAAIEQPLGKLVVPGAGEAVKVPSPLPRRTGTLLTVKLDSSTAMSVLPSALRSVAATAMVPFGPVIGELVALAKVMVVADAVMGK